MGVEHPRSVHAVRDFEEVAAKLRGDMDRHTLGRCLDLLADLAPGHKAALHLLLEQIVRRRLAEASIRAFLFDDSLVDDAVQDTLVAVAVGIGSFRGDAGFLTWLDRVARNEARSIVRKKQRLSEPVSNEVPETTGWARRLSSVVAHSRSIEEAMATMDPSYRQVLELREFDELTYDQIAERLDLPLNTVRTRLRRARQQLAGLLINPDPSRPTSEG